MFYKGIIFDLDNTLYDYTMSHKIALMKVFHSLSENTPVSYHECYSAYDEIAQHLKHELNHTASSHNKTIYFKHLLERFPPAKYSLLPVLQELYWRTFYENMKSYEGVVDFLQWNREKGIQMAILTDYETEYQIIKLEKLGLLEYFDVIITSEEVGIEKPASPMFQTALKKMKLPSTEVIMIGDNLERDIRGAIHSGIFGYWFHENNAEREGFAEFNCFTTLLHQFQEIHRGLCEFKEMSRFCGERFDLVQAGGGNTSVKIHQWMFIKASGYNLTNVGLNTGYAMIHNQKLLEDIRAQKVKEVLNYNVITKTRGSIETFMHSILKKYTVHLHPIQINRVLVSERAQEIVKELFPDSLIIPYLTPGIQVCNEILKTYKGENLIFLANHGIIITSNDYSEIYTILEKVVGTFERIQQLDFEKYRFTNTLSAFMKRHFDIDCVSYLCENRQINQYLLEKPELLKERITFPDALIYCGAEIAVVAELDELIGIDTDICYHEEIPKIFVIQGKIYITGTHLHKCKEIEDVLLSNWMIVDSNDRKNYLSKEEIGFLNHWDAEKYRKNL